MAGRADRRLSKLARERAEQFDATICYNRVSEAVEGQHDHGPDLQRFVDVTEDVYALAADEDLEDRRLDVFGAAEELNDHIDAVADEVVAAHLTALLAEIDGWDDLWDDEPIVAAKEEARNWLQGHPEAAKRAGV